MTSGTRIAENVPIVSCVLIDVYPRSKPPIPRFHGPFIVFKKLDKGAILLFFYKMVLNK
jgi:hypothetical protein